MAFHAQWFWRTREHVPTCSLISWEEVTIRRPFGKGGGGVALERILFVLPIVRSKLELFLMRPLQAKFGKICQRTKKIKDAVLYGWGRQIFPKSPKENKNSSNVSAACLFKKIDARYCLEKPFIRVYTRN